MEESTQDVADLFRRATPEQAKMAMQMPRDLAVKFLRDMLDTDKPRRGRPKSHPDWQKELITDGYATKGERAARNQINSFRVLRLLVDCAGFDFSYLGYDPSKKRPAGVRIKRTILMELSQFGDDATILDYARQLCELKPATTAQAVAILKECRGVRKAGSAGGLAACLFSALNKYHLKNPVTLTDALKAIDWLRDQVVQNFGGEDS